jgi:hypothetical protein
MFRSGRKGTDQGAHRFRLTLTQQRALMAVRSRAVPADAPLADVVPRVVVASLDAPVRPGTARAPGPHLSIDACVGE